MSTRVFRRLRVAALALAFGVGCSTTQNAPIGSLPDLPPEYVQVPHPDGLDRADLIAIFTDLKAPSPETLKTCDADYALLKKRTNSRDEQQMGARELVRRDPVKYHWCFYGKLLELDDRLKNDVYLDEKQKSVLQIYGFLTPMGRAFMQEFADTRYMRWAVHRYRRLSEYVFYRRLELTPRATEELAAASNPFGAVRPNKESSTSVLTKYGIVKPDQLIGTISPTGPAPEANPESGATANSEKPPVEADPASPSLMPEGTQQAATPETLQATEPARDVATSQPAKEGAVTDPVGTDPLLQPPPAGETPMDPLLQPIEPAQGGQPGAAMESSLQDPLVTQTQGTAPTDPLVDRAPGSTELPGAVKAELKAEAPKDPKPANPYQNSESEVSAILNGDSVVTPEGSSLLRRPATAPLRPFRKSSR
jgi:hypothetical protein